MRHLRDRSVISRAAWGVIALTLVLIMSECTGGSGSSPQGSGTAATVGKLCMTSDYVYQVEVSGSQSYEREVEVNPFESVYQGSIGGQIRGLAILNVSIPDADVSEIIFWGSGATIKYGTAEHTLDTVLLDRPGAVNDIAPIVYSGKQMLVYGTERGLGFAGPNAAGTSFIDYSSTGAWRSVPEGVMSVAVTEDGSAIIFTTADGFVQQITPAELMSGESCSGIISAEVLAAEGDVSYVPTRTQVGSGQIFVLSKSADVATTTAPTYEQAFYPIFRTMMEEGFYSRVRAYGMSGGVTDVGFTAKDGSFDRFDKFIATDLAWDGQQLYVVGLAYQQSSVYDFLAQKCEGASNQLRCLSDAVRDGSLAGFVDEGGVFKFVAGFFVYRDVVELSQADYFQKIHLNAIKFQEEAPPLIYAMAAQSETVFIRGPNFLVSYSRVEGSGGSENWDAQTMADKNDGLVAGLPNRVVPYLGGAASSFTAIRQADGVGTSALELMSSGGVFSVKDTGSVFVRVDGAASTSNLVAAIEMENSRGGKLYLESAVKRYNIDPGLGAGEFVSHAAYDGSTLAFSSSRTGSTEATNSWHIFVQDGRTSSTRGDLNVAKIGGSDGIFDDFPIIETSDENPSLTRGVGGMALAGDALAVLYRGYKAGKWYHQVARYELTKTGDQFETPTFVAGTSMIPTTAGGAAHEGRILKMKQVGSSYEIYFSTPKAIYKWDGSSASAASQYTDDKLVDASVDAVGGTKIAIVAGFKVYVRQLSSMSSGGSSVAVAQKEGTSMSSLLNARVALSGAVLALASPYGAASTFSAYEVGSSSISELASTNLSRFFDVKLFSSFSDYLLASSQASGIEMYLLTGE